MKPLVKTSNKSPMVSPRSNTNATKSTPLKNQTPLSKFKVIKQCVQQNPQSQQSYKQQISTLKKYVTQLQTMVSQQNIQYLYMKGLMQMQHKKVIELQSKYNLQTKSWQDKLLTKQKQQQQKNKEIQLLNRQIQSYRKQISQLDYQKSKIQGQKIIKQNQLQQYKYKTQTMLTDKNKQIQLIHQKQIQRIQQLQSIKQLQLKTKPLNNFSKMEELSYLITKQTSQQFVIQDTKRITTLQNRIRLNSLEYQNQLLKLKNQIKKINQCYKQEMASKQKQIKADMLYKYQSKINLIPNLKNQIKKLEQKIIEKDKMMENMQKKQLTYKIMQFVKNQNDKIIRSEYNQATSSENQNTK